MSFFATVPDSILGLLIGTFWMTVHIECFGIQPALSYCCHHFQLNKLCIAMISDKYDDHTSQSLHATPRNHERFFTEGTKPRSLCLHGRISSHWCWDSLSTLNGPQLWVNWTSVTIIYLRKSHRSSNLIFMDISWYFWIHIGFLSLQTRPRPVQVTSMAFFDNFTKILMICSTLIPLAMAAVKDRDVIWYSSGPWVKVKEVGFVLAKEMSHGSGMDQSMS